MNFGRIRRGPMAADAFTQIRNALFRDSRLAFRDKGIFGLISTHRDGYGVSAESIAACSPTDGVTAVKTSLRKLEQYGYLQRTRHRNPDGTLGSAVYFITDQPEAFAVADESQRCRSEPAVAQPPLAEPTQAEPTVAGPAVVSPTVAKAPHKKISSKKTSGKKTLSPPTPSASLPAQVERDIAAEPDNDQAQQVADAWQTARGGRRNPAAHRMVKAAAAELLAAGWPLVDVTALAEDMARTQPAWRDLTRHADHWQPPRPGRPEVVLPDWCGQCDGPELARRWVTRDDGIGRCSRCHPHGRQAAA